MPTGIQARAQNAVMANTLRNRLLVTTALAPLVLGGLLSLAPGPAHAACTVVGTGTIGALDSGDVATCTGVGNTDLVDATGKSDVTVNIGTGAAAASLTTALHTIVLDGTSSSQVNVREQATVESTTFNAIVLTGSANNNTVSVATGGLVTTTSNATPAIVLFNSSNNTINIGGTVFGNALGAKGINVGGTSASNVFNILAGGSVLGSQGITFTAGGNVINNAGTISGSTDTGITGSTGVDTVFNSGVVTGGGGTAINLNGGADALTLVPGSTITGKALGGTGIDTLGFDGTGSATFNLGNLGAGLQYDEFELLRKTGISVWTLTGATAFNGATTVEAGGLIVNGTLPSVVTVHGGYLGGSGTIGGLVVNNFGTVAPGNSIGTINVNGNVTFNAGSYQVEINAAGQSDKIAATGTATLNGGTVQIVPLGTGFLANTQYTIVTAAGGVTGTFASLAPLTAPLVSGQLSYDANNVYFLLQQVAGFGTLTGLTPNQSAVSTTLDQAQLGGASGPLSTAINTLAALNTPGIKAGLDDLAGQIHADGRRFTTDQAGAFQNFMWNAGTQSRGETVRMSASSYAPEPTDPIGKALRARRAAPAQSVWFGGYGNWDRVAATDIAFGTNTASAAPRSVSICGTAPVPQSASQSAHRPARSGRRSAPTGSMPMPATPGSMRAARATGSTSHRPSAIPSRRWNPRARSPSWEKPPPASPAPTRLPPRSASPGRSSSAASRPSPLPTSTGIDAAERRQRNRCPRRESDGTGWRLRRAVRHRGSALDASNRDGQWPSGAVRRDTRRAP